jgi:hypothetical protein
MFILLLYRPTRVPVLFYTIYYNTLVPVPGCSTYMVYDGMPYNISD